MGNEGVSIKANILAILEGLIEVKTMTINKLDVEWSGIQ